MTNMNKDEKRLMLFDMQEHPENYTDEQVERLLADDEVKDFLHGLAMARMAAKKATPQQVDVDKAWKEFAMAHGEAKPVGIGRMKIAASVAGFIFLAGVALAAVQSGWFGGAGTRQKDKAATEQVATMPTMKDSLKAVDSAPKDSADKKPVVFDNAELGTILTQMASFYHVQVAYHNTQAQHVRLFFNWNKAKTLEQNLEMLNAFDRIQLEYTEGVINVR